MCIEREWAVLGQSGTETVWFHWLRQLSAVVGSIKSDGRDAVGGGRQGGTGS
jgi:hypothetical protein